MVSVGKKSTTAARASSRLQSASSGVARRRAVRVATIVFESAALCRCDCSLSLTGLSRVAGAQILEQVAVKKQQDARSVRLHAGRMQIVTAAAVLDIPSVLQPASRNHAEQQPAF